MNNPVPSALRNLPEVGPWASRIGRVIQFYNWPCNIKPAIWVYAAWRVTPMALLAAVKPSPTEFALTRFGVSHHKRPRFKFTSAAEVPGAANPIPGEFTHALFKGAKIGAAGLQYLQFADIATKALLNWHSLVYTYSGCEGPIFAVGDQDFSGQSVQLGSLTGTLLNIATTVQQQHHCVGGAMHWAGEPGIGWAAMFDIQWTPAPGYPQAAPTFDLVDGGGDTLFTGGFENAPGDNGAKRTAKFWWPGASTNPTDFDVRYTSNYSFIVTSAEFNIWGNPLTKLLPDP